MKRFLRRTLFCLVPAALAALMLGVPTAAPKVSLQPVTIACSVDSPFTLSADPATVTQLGLALVAMTDPSCGITQTDPSAAPAQTFAVGGGLTDDGTKFSFSAHQNTHAPASGYAHISSPTAFGGMDAQGHVVCLNQSANRGEIGFEFEKGGIAHLPNARSAVFLVEDNGPPGSLPPDGFHVFTASDFPTIGCGTFGGSFGNVVQGNIVVK